jgi:DNA-binding transcriptional LysR family regulator
MDKHHLISVFVAVVDANGFAGAARKLQVSPPVVTRAINELEETLGVRLLTRTTRVVRVTEAGARYANDCRRILAELAEADESASGQHGARLVRGQVHHTDRHGVPGAAPEGERHVLVPGPRGQPGRRRCGRGRANRRPA